ncbi:MAG: 1-deoxy-D-xylulose-5-phosphate reductoisomerase [Clostridia bacterium]|nr:1-deoxy-D-xylulose-5-phosphate reductoisomerase [Clostridia bacterium]
MKKVCILGSTGSIGTQAIDVIASSGNLEVTALAARSNISLLSTQIRQFRPKLAAVYDENLARKLRDDVADMPTRILAGIDGVREVAAESGADITVTAMVGSMGILPTLDAIAAGSDIALANKETMVCAGDIVRDAAKRNNVRIVPVDSEHSAIFQCIGEKKEAVKRIFLTASGGPFVGKTKKELENVTVADALRHPNWSMGAKITVDSASMMNKGLEVLEAVQLFDVRPEDIQVVVHRQSIVHSMVEFKDNSVLAQLGWPDMRLPIAYALSYPEVPCPAVKPLDFSEMMTLTFENPDLETFGCLRLGFEAAKAGGTMPTAYSSAGEAAVELFLNEKCTFLELEYFVEETLRAHKLVINPTLSCIIDTDTWARDYVRALWEGKQK